MSRIPKDKKKEYDSKRYVKNKEKIIARSKAWAEKNKDTEKYKAMIKAIGKKARSKPEVKKRKAHHEALRRAIKKNAIPKSITKEHLIQIKEIYLNCPDGWTVDHISPLKGQKSCGLHVPWNLRYLPPSLNYSKSNLEMDEYMYPIIDFHLERDVDTSGVSGTGIVAYGCVLPSGKVVMEWNSEFPTIEILDNVGKLYTIHGHHGNTRVVMDMNLKKKKKL